MSYEDADHSPGWLKAEARQEWWALTKARREDARKGIRPHALDMTDPWSDTEQRRCTTNCAQHKGHRA